MAADLSGLDPLALLGRAELPIDLAPARRLLRGRRILITGAGGSVGAALAELVIELEPASVLLLDHYEHSLFELYRRYSPRLELPPVDFALADVRHTARLRELLASARPEVVFHLAAYKHVPFGEKFPDEVVAVNVLATRQLLELCTELEVEAFVYPSSDKAVDPPSLYGATKRLSETLVQRVGSEQGRSFAVARYVNIIGTRGSVIETLARQVERGEPLTITDPAMTRYWITMAEALWLATSVASCDPAGGVGMLDAREEVPVVEMAGRLAAQLGARLEPQRLRFTGARPGERLREQLLSANERFAPGPLPGLLRVENQRHDQNLERVEGLVAGLADLLERGNRGMLRQYAMAAAMALQ
ncbi:MAG: polysaccharide biosynthesis protein [Chloroflexi bacterium]|nr:polysaccharide biosynthesis protein [Chloroflexota bacterium]